MKKIIYLTGFMGAGKSTIGPILANTLGWKFYDLDRIIEHKTNKSIREIFSDHGEKYFREIENQVLQELSTGDYTIISLGGGTIASSRNLDLMKSSGKIIYLYTSPEIAYHRLKYKNDRPSLLIDGNVAPGKEILLEKINKLMTIRNTYYEKADYKISTENVPVGRTVDIIAKLAEQENFFRNNKATG